jgi:hypothetical protein
MSEPSSNETIVPAAIKRARMPLATLSDMIAWLHRKVTAHHANSLRWAKENRELRNLTDRLRRNVGPRGLKDGTVELKHRKTGERETLSIEAAVGRLKALIVPQRRDTV